MGGCDPNHPTRQDQGAPVEGMLGGGGAEGLVLGGGLSGPRVTWGVSNIMGLPLLRLWVGWLGSRL